MARRGSTNYLNNRDLLIEIHKSKTSFCEFDDFKYANFDAIIHDIKALTDDNICQELYEKDVQTFIADTKKMKIHKMKKEDSECDLTEEDILTGDLVFRFMTFEHIPADPNWPEGKDKKKASDGYFKVKFPPYQHVILENGSPRIVGYSHYRDNEFDPEAGSITPKLGHMFMLLVEKISKKGNWRNYCIDEETEALTQRGWLNIDEINENDLILSYSYEDSQLKWSKIKSIYRGHFDGLMHKLTTKTGLDMLITPEHKLLTERGLVKAEYLLESDKIILMGNPVSGVNTKIYSDEFVEFIGWLVTKGSYEFTKSNNKIKSIRLSQNVGEKANRIRHCLNKLRCTYTERPNKKNNKLIHFAVHKKDSEKICEILPEKNLSMDIILSLTMDQRELLISTMIDGDGWRVGKYRRYCQKNKKHIDLFQALCVMSGHRSNTHLIENHLSFGKITSFYDMNIFSPRKNYAKVESINFYGGKRNGRTEGVTGKGKRYHPNQPTAYYNGMVWCPETEYGCFMARRNGTVYLTGNTYLDEMKSSALLQLSQVGLQFDESRGQIPNPFAFYTTCVNNAFKRVLNVEKKNRDIRDDLIEIAGQNPSFSRQMENHVASNEQAADNSSLQMPNKRTKKKK